MNDKTIYIKCKIIQTSIGFKNILLKKEGDIEIELSKEIIVDDLFQEKVFGTNNWLLRNRLAVSFEFCSSLILGKFPYKDVRGPLAEFDVFFKGSQ